MTDGAQHPGGAEDERWSHWLERTLLDDPAAASFIQSILGPLLRYDALHGGDLVRTVEVLAAVSWSPSRAARRLFLLRNSVLYRRARIEEITGHSLGDPRRRLLLTMATRLHRARATTIADPTEDATDAEQCPQPPSRHRS